jgi:uncharacterized protein (DUF1697 family)
MKAKSNSASIKYAAFLRGINVGGHKTVPMEELKRAFESIGYQNVKTLLASGNVLFDAPRESPVELTRKIGGRLEKTFGFEIGVWVREIEEIQKLVDSAPFKNIRVTPQTRLYVTLISGKPKGALQIPYESPGKEIQILHASVDTVLSVVNLSLGVGTIDLMVILEKEFGKNSTTRNWNTIVKMLGK